MSKKPALFLLAALMLQTPLCAAAKEETKEIRLDPPSDMSSAPTIGELTICCDSSMFGSVFEVHLRQEEGDLLYYSFTSRYEDEVRIVCPLKKDGDYQLIVKVPQENLADLQPYIYLFSVEDPDPADHPSDFDFTELTRRFTVDPSAVTDTADDHEAVLEKRIYRGESSYTYARKAFLPGDANSDGLINARDANTILVAAAALGVDRPTGLSSLESAKAELNGDGTLNAKDAMIVLTYSAAIGANAFSGNILEFMRS